MKSLGVQRAAYLAGAIDGEGSISLVPNRRSPTASPRYDFRITITNTKRAWLVELRRWVGGGRIDRWESRGNKRPCYGLFFRAQEAKDVLLQCMPYLLIKRRHAQLMLQYFELAAQRRVANLPGRRLPIGVVRAMSHIHQRLKQMNLRGKVPIVNPGPPRSQRTCSIAECGRKHYSNGYCKQHHKKYIERGGPTSYEKHCARCGTLFVSKRSDARFCSKRCADHAYYAQVKTSA